MGGNEFKVVEVTYTRDDPPGNRSVRIFKLRRIAFVLLLKAMSRLSKTTLPVGPQSRLLTILLLAATTAFGFGCSNSTDSHQPDLEVTEYFSYAVVNTYPHDNTAFTQGLQWVDTVFYEGTGLSGVSDLRRVHPVTGEVLQQRPIAKKAVGDYFGEGITVLGDRIFQLTWLDHIGFVYDRTTFDSLGFFTYPTQGWGLTHDGERFIMSDGTARLYFYDSLNCLDCGADDPNALDFVTVHDSAGPIVNLNELEYVAGTVYANVWTTNRIVSINPASGFVTGSIDLSGLLAPEDLPGTNVLNGIAWNTAQARLYVTGKLWPKLFEIELVDEF